MEIKNARNPKWIGQKKEGIHLEIQLDGTWRSYSAVSNDSDSCGKLLYNLAINGVFGKIEESDEEKILRGDMKPPEGSVLRDGQIIYIKDLEDFVNYEINRRLTVFTSDESKARAEFDSEYAQERKKIMKHLLDVKFQEGYPFEVKWDVDP